MRTEYEIWKDIQAGFQEQKKIIAEIDGMLYRDGKLDESADTERMIAALKKETSVREKTMAFFAELHEVKNRFKITESSNSLQIRP